MYLIADVPYPWADVGWARYNLLVVHYLRVMGLAERGMVQPLGVET